MRNWRIGPRLALAFALLLALMLVAIAVAFVGLRGAADQASRLERENVVLLNAANAMRVAQLSEAVAMRDFVSLPDVESQQAALRTLTASEKSYVQAAAALAEVATRMQKELQVQEQLARIGSAGAKVAARMKDAMAQAEQAEYQDAQAIVYKEVRPLQAEIAKELESLVARSNALSQGRAEAARAQAARSEQRLLAAAVAALLLGIVATLVVTRGITRPLQAAVVAAERVAEGDLTALHVEARGDETGRLLAALAGMQQRLNALVRTIRDGSDAVGRASEQIASGNTDLAGRTEEQAASLEETAASIEELTASVKQNSEHAAKASELAGRAAKVAESSGEAVGSVVARMHGIQGSSRKVSDIVGLLDGIAFQTNLLALNAAVEAARAGAQGRGFAVVAAEVRALAQRSAEASKDIKKLVTEAVSQADEGARAAGGAGAAMREVVQVVGEVAAVVAHMARATEEQRTGIEQVNGTIAQLEGVTQSNSTLVQEISALTEALLGQARELVTATGRFKLEHVEVDILVEAPDAPPSRGSVPLSWEAAPAAQ
jgi:methyl-accepting chemotaxis protein